MVKAGHSRHVVDVNVKVGRSHLSRRCIKKRQIRVYCFKFFNCFLCGACVKCYSPTTEKSAG